MNDHQISEAQAELDLLQRKHRKPTPRMVELQVAIYEHYHTYLTPQDEHAFLDFEIKEPPIEWYPDRTCVCPVCHGHGGWNLRVNCYPTHGRPREFGHFRCSCNQCNGYGWVTPQETKCIHEFVEISYQEAKALGVRHEGRCWHVTKCTKCGATQSHDSSD
jgi:hypothetical protein